MQRLTSKRVIMTAGVLFAVSSLAGASLVSGEAQAPSGQGGAASGQSATTGSAQAAVAQTVAAYECVQVPVTYSQTCYRTEYRTENVPVTRMVREVVNETRTISYCVPKQQTVDKKIVRYVCEPTTVVQKCYRPICVTKNVERTCYQVNCTVEMTNKVITRMIPECVTETVPVTRMRKIVEPQVCYVTQRDPRHNVCAGCHLKCAPMRAPLRRWLRWLRKSLRPLQPGDDLLRAAGGRHPACGEVYPGDIQRAADAHEVQPRPAHCHGSGTPDPANPVQGDRVRQHD